jgi:putative hemolysin
MTLFAFFVILVLVAVNALYVAAEFSAVAVQKSQLAGSASAGSRRAAGLLEVLEDGAQLDRYIAACQIGITLSSLVAGAFGQATIGTALASRLVASFGVSTSAAHSWAFLSVLIVLTVLQVVLGELVPKSLALQFPEATALLTYLPTRWSAWLYRPFIWLLNGSGFLFLKPFGITAGGHQHVHSPDEIQLLLKESRKGGALSPETFKRLERGLLLSTKKVRQMMTPRSEIYAIEVSTPPEEVLERLLLSPYSRVPIYRDSLDQVLGAVNIKDVASFLAIRGKMPSLEAVLRPMPFVPESLRAHRFVRLLQEKQSSKAIVVDEFGGIQGIISIEDVLTQLFGDIGDELKDIEPGIETLADGSVRLPGSMSLDEAERWLGTRWEGSASTVGGHIIAHLRRLPVQGESLEIDGVFVTVIDMGATAVRFVVVKPKERLSSPLNTLEPEEPN